MKILEHRDWLKVAIPTIIAILLLAYIVVDYVTAPETGMIPPNIQHMNKYEYPYRVGEEYNELGDGGEFVNLMEEDWDVLILLDAARYDKFRDTYKPYLEGDLQPAIAPSTCTIEWLNKVFPNVYDNVTYISSNPYVNKGETENYNAGLGYIAKNHFSEIREVWLTGYDESLGSIPPDEITNAFLEEVKKKPNTRYILHYMQPHYPYIGEKHRPPAEDRQRSKLGRFIEDELGNSIFWFVARIYHYNRKIPEEKIVEEKGIDGLHRAYTENLEVALESISHIPEEYDGKILITADHGEFLGEYEIYRHSCSLFGVKENTEVPWMKVNFDG
ncbi:hypothetical protein ACFLRC_04560 [Candidatus Altiarchaeota archaeon]